MTTMADTEEQDDIAVIPEPVEEHRARRTPDVRRCGTRVVVGALTLLVLWLVCADPVSHVWYQARQKSLTTQAANAITQLGSQVPRSGGSVAVLQDPTIGLNVVVAEGDTPSILHGGPGHRPGTPYPGAKGNSVVVGHDKDWGAPFKNLSKLAVGSQLYLQAHPGVYKLPETGDFIYTVRSVSKTTGDAARFLAPSNDHRLTLITDDGGRLSGNKLLVITAISGSVGRVTGPGFGSLVPSKGPLIFNREVLEVILGGLASVLAYRLLSRNHRRTVVLVVLVPLVATTLFALFLEFDVVVMRPLA
jgi:LPXTG-site transpeptidase (sortase) family protein